MPRLRLGLRSLFVLLGLLVLVIAGAGLVVFRVYDNQLIRQTEAELIAQGASLASMYRQALLAELTRKAGAPDLKPPRPAQRGEVAEHSEAGEGPPVSRPNAQGLPGGAPEREPSLTSYGNPVADGFRPLYDPSLPLRPRPALLSLGNDAIRPSSEPPRAPTTPPDPLAQAAGATLDKVLRETRQTTLAGIRVVDFRGTVIATSNTELGLSLAHREEVGRALRGEMVSLFRRRISDQPPPSYGSLSRETGVRVFVALPVVAEDRVLGAVVLARTPMTLGKAFYQDRFSLLAIAAILVAAVLAVSLLAAALIVRPVRGLIRQTQAIAAGEASGMHALAHAGTREIAQLSQSFADMATRLSQRAEYIKGFAASLSHEFKTPLTAIAGTAELLRDHGASMNEEERARFFANLTADTQRLGELVHRVLELARADMMAPGDARTNVAEALARVADTCRGEGMKVEVANAEHAGEARIDGETLVAILGHLADNARKHGGAEVTLRFEMKAGDDSASLVIEISDDGPGISEANRARVFDPFFTTARDRGGTGMGLNIARALLQAHGGALELEPSDKGARFRLTMPA